MARNWEEEKNPNYVDIQKEELEEKVLEGLTSKELAEYFDVNQNTITSKVNKFWNEGLRKVRKKLYKINHKYGSCKVCGNPLKRTQSNYCSNECKFSDDEYNNSRVPDVENEENKKASCKRCDYESKDYNNVSGALTKHRNEKHQDCEVEELFEVVEAREKEYLECPECEWKTEDVDNDSGALTKHIKNEHNLTLDEFLEIYPDFKNLFLMWKRNKERSKTLQNEDAYVRCEICGNKFKMITNSHCEGHGISQKEYKEEYGSIVSERTRETLREVYGEGLGRIEFTSRFEDEIYAFLKEDCNVENIERNKRNVIHPFELDLFLPEFSLGIEFNGLYWHSQNSAGKTETYHLNKTKRCEEEGIQLIHIFEDEWREKKDIVKSRLKYIHGVHDGERIYGRECEVKEIDPTRKNEFLEQHHIQGEDRSSVKLGLVDDGKLVSVMTFSSPRAFQSGSYEENTWEISRFCSHKNRIVLGAFGKLFKNFLREESPDQVITYADRRYTSRLSNVYEDYGFDLESSGTPNYWYTDYKTRKHRFNFTKSRIVEEYNGDPELTEWENMKEMEYDRIWDCGHLKYVWS